VTPLRGKDPNVACNYLNKVVVGLAVFYWIKGKGDTTLTISTFSIMTLSITTLSKWGFYVPLSISDSQHK
jgi:hypothetical protein